MIEVRLKELLKGREKSLYWLAAASGVTYNTLHAVANGKRDSIHFPTLEKICEALDCQAGEVIVYVPTKKDIVKKG
jgi:putative transcriptional regulator